MEYNKEQPELKENNSKTSEANIKNVRKQLEGK